jgi:HSP20 family protein
MLMRFDPFRELDRVADLFGQRGGATFSQAAMPMDAFRRGDEFVVCFDLPGVDPDQIDMTVEKNVLTVRAERQLDDQGQDGEIVISERPRGTFSRQVFLGESLDADRVEASYQNGVLTVTIPVAEQAKPRRVQVSGQGGGERRTIEASSSEERSSS